MSESWDKSFVKKIQSIIEAKVTEWVFNVERLGMDRRNREEWAEVFQNQVLNKMNELVLDVQQTVTELHNNIESCSKKAGELCKMLGIGMPKNMGSGRGLYEQEQLMKKYVSELEGQVKQRLDKLKTLRSREESVCANIETKPTLIKDSPLPSLEQIETYINHIEELEEERAMRENLYNKLKLEIEQVAAELKYEPQLDFERMILYRDRDDFIYSDSNMEKLKEFHGLIIEIRDEMKREIALLRESVENAWEILGEDVRYRKDFMEGHPDDSVETCMALKDEVKRCEMLKKANIQNLVQKLREEMKTLWDKCKLTNEQRSEFSYYTNDTYTEDLLTLHDLEVNRLKNYLQDNKEIFELLDKREGLWSKMLEIEERSQAPNRFQNRGGQLLKEEKERKALMKRLPKIEEKLLQLTTEYGLKNGSEFLYWGETVNMIIKRSHEDYENEKKERLSARKQQREVMCSTSGSSKKKTPTGPSPRSNCKTPVETITSKRLLLTPTPTSGKQLKTQKSGLKTAPSAMSKATTRPKLRYSSEKKKRIEKVRQLSKKFQAQKRFSSAVYYRDFEVELKSRGSCRSTMLQGGKEKNIPQIVITPCLKSPQESNLPSE